MEGQPARKGMFLGTFILSLNTPNDKKQGLWLELNERFPPGKSIDSASIVDIMVVGSTELLWLGKCIFKLPAEDLEEQWDSEWVYKLTFQCPICPTAHIFHFVFVITCGIACERNIIDTTKFPLLRNLEVGSFEENTSVETGPWSF